MRAYDVLSGETSVVGSLSADTEEDLGGDDQTVEENERSVSMRRARTNGKR